jgi:hypothetical protein
LVNLLNNNIIEIKKKNFNKKDENVEDNLILQVYLFKLKN